MCLFLISPSLKYLDPGNYVLELHDITGKQVMRKELSIKDLEGSCSMNLDGLKQGTYLIRLFTDKALFYEDHLAIVK